MKTKGGKHEKTSLLLKFRSYIRSLLTTTRVSASTKPTKQTSKRSDSSTFVRRKR